MCIIRARGLISIGIDTFIFRFSLTRSDTTDIPTTSACGSRSNSGDSNSPGFPKVLPAPGASALVQRRKSTLEVPLVPAPPIRRPGSFRQKSPRATPERPPTFCIRRQSWPEINLQVNSRYAFCFWNTKISTGPLKKYFSIPKFQKC